MVDTKPTGFRLQQLPKLDKRDIGAARSFLPGKLLGRTAALRLLVLLTLGFAGTVERMLNSALGVDLGVMSWLCGTLLIGLPALAVGAQVVPEWRAERQRQRRRDLAVQPGQVPQGHFRRSVLSRGVACAALVLLTLTGLDGGPATAGQRLGELDQIRSELAQSGLAVTIEAHHSSLRRTCISRRSGLLGRRGCWRG